MRLQALLRRGDESRIVHAEGPDLEAAKLALQSLIEDDEQVLSYRPTAD